LHKITNNFFIINLITSIDTTKFLKREIAGCTLLESYMGDILSTFEKEILLNSSAFYRARPSNWSFNVQGQRFATHDELPYDRTIFDVFLDI